MVLELLFLGIDIGTTGTKSILFDEKGSIVSRAYQGYGLTTPAPGWVEQDPQDWWEAVKFTVKECLKENRLHQEVRALAISAQGGSIALLDRDHKLLGRAISWLDTRAKGGRQAFIDAKGAEYYHERTGFTLKTGLAMQEIKWLQTQDQDRFAKTSAIYSTLDYLNFRLTGRAALDPSCAALMQLLNVKEKNWDSEILDLISLDQGRLAPLKPAGSLVGRLTAEAAAELGLPESVEVFNGGLDQACMALGCGAVNSGDIVLSTGTAWAMLAVTDRPNVIKGLKFSVIPHTVQDKWCFMATIPSAGAGLDWLREKLLGFDEAESYKVMDGKIAGREPGAKGLVVFPFFSEGAGLTSQITGLTLAHDRYDLLRAYLESICYEIKRMLDALEQEGLRLDCLRVTGGASRSKIWMSILSNILNKAVRVETNPDAACIGAGKLAAMGSGCPTAEFGHPADPGNGVQTVFEPDPGESLIYQGLYEKYSQNRPMEK